MARWKTCLRTAFALLQLILVFLLLFADGRADDALAPDSYEPNDRPADAHALAPLTLDQTQIVRANFHGPEDHSDWYSIMAGGSAAHPRIRVAVGVTQPDSDSPIEVILFDGSSEVARQSGTHKVLAAYEWSPTCGYVNRAICPGTIHIHVKQMANGPPRSYDLLVTGTVPAPPPRIVSVSPKSGSPGTTITVTGEHFGSTATVTFGDLPAVIKSAGPTALKVTVPSGAATAPVVVTTTHGTASSAEPFTIIPGGEISGQEHPCCTMKPVRLNGRLGRLTVRYPGGAQRIEAKVEVYKAGQRKRAGAGNGNKSWNLASGLYDVVINGKRVQKVPVESGHETLVKTGGLRVAVDKKTRVEVLDPETGAVLSEWSGDKTYGFPVGPVGVKVQDETRMVTIDDGHVTEF